MSYTESGAHCDDCGDIIEDGEPIFCNTCVALMKSEHATEIEKLKDKMASLTAALEGPEWAYKEGSEQR